MTDNSTPNNLPLQLTRFIGREGEITEISRLLTSTRLLTLTGSGGCGKTRLSLQVAAKLLDAFPDGVWFVDLASLSDSSLVPQTIATAFDLQQISDTPIGILLQNFFRAKNLLLVLDNCEHLIQVCAELSDTLLHTCPDLKILATSIEALGVVGETAYRVPSLVVPDPQHLPPIESLSQYDAVRLFIDRAISIQSTFNVNQHNARAVTQICHRLDGIPLAIELAAARIKIFSAEEIEARLDDRFRLLTGGGRTTLPRHQTLRALIDWSFDLLTESERVLLSRLSVFAGGWTVEAAETVASDRSIEETEHRLLITDLLDLLSHLIDKSLVLAEEHDGVTRYRMLETIRQYAHEKLLASGERESMQNRHLEYFMELAEEAEPKLLGADQMTWFKRLDSEHDNLRIALDWSSTDDRIEKGLRLGGALERFWLTRGYWSEGYQGLAGMLKIKGADTRTLVRGKALQAAGGLAGRTRSAEISRRLYGESISILRELGTAGRPWLASTLGRYAFSHIFNDLDTARTCAEETAQLSRESGNIPDLAQALAVLGIVASWKCEFAVALQFFEETRALHQEIGDNRGVTAAINNLAWTYINQGDIEKGKELDEQSITITKEMGNKYQLSSALMQLGIISQISDQRNEAESLLHQALSALRELGNKTYIALTHMHLGRLHLRRGHYAQAQQDLRESLGLFREVSAIYFIPHTLDSFAFLLSVSGNAQRAVRLFGAAQALREKFGTPLSPGYRKEYESYFVPTRAQLNGATFNAAWTEGRAMTMEQVLEYALAEQIEEVQPTVSAQPHDPNALTPREIEVLRLAQVGLSDAKIAEKLVISPRTVNTHLSSIYSKLGVKSRSAATRYALDHKLI